ncbi:MAG: hypothetical protein R3F59_04725 [Myxococcota bacterium]
MRSLLLASVVALAAGCPHHGPTAPVIEAASRNVETAADVAGAEGVLATVVGTLERVRPEGVAADGTAIVLRDGTPVYVSEGAPPEGWDWMLDSQVRVQGKLWAHAPSGWPVAKLLEAEAPMPADVSILLGAPPE